jgi:C4-dicarboxylate transporter
MTRDEWLAAFAAAAGVPAPAADEIEALLELAAVAAHASERTAAPVTCWIAAMAGLAPADALALAESLPHG